MKTRPFDVILAQLVNSVNGTSMLYGQQEHEDIIDYMHRLAKSGLSARRISELTDVPLRNVLYWYQCNGYGDSTCDLEYLGEKR